VTAPQRSSTSERSPARIGSVREALAFMLGLAILVALSVLGEWLVRVTGATVPGSVVGMLLFTALLETRVLPAALVRRAAEFLVRHLALLYVPAGVTLIVYWSAVQHELLPITLAALASLVAVLVVVGITVQRFERAP
jgi:holin-like protein